MINTRKTRFHVFILFQLFIPVILFGCLGNEVQRPLKIAVSKAGPGDHYGKYAQWLQIQDTTLKIINCFDLPHDSAIQVLEYCDGLLLTGGPDVHPDFYGGELKKDVPFTIDLRRDSLEFMLIEKALELNLPVLAICRGLQIMNVSQGGTLIFDIPTETENKVFHRCPDKNNCYHQINIDTTSLLYETISMEIGFVNSNHHQGIKKLAGVFKASARTEDGLIEAIEWKDKKNKSFFIGVQWHPERLDESNPFSLPVALYFLKSAEIYNLNK